jgi:hypothetical protein
MLTFHLDGHHLPKLTEALDDAAEQLASHPDFRGFVCLDHDSVRHQIIILSLWDGDGLEATNPLFKRATEIIASCADLGMNNTTYDVLRLVPGAVLNEDAFGLVGAS